MPLCLAATSDAIANAVYVPVGKAKTRKTIIAIPAIKPLKISPGQDSILTNIHKKLIDNLTFVDLFRFISPKAFIENTFKAGVAPGEFNYANWTAIQTDFLIKVSVGIDGNTLNLSGYLYDVKGQKPILSRNYVGRVADSGDIANTFSNHIVETLTGLPGIFNTKILASCEKNGRKEIYVMNFDGSATRQITKHQSIAFSPAWHPDGNKFAYSLYVTKSNNQKNINLYEYNFDNNQVRLLSNRRGINSGSTYSPDGKNIALTMSFLGNPEIFLLNTSSRSVERMTKSFGFDVDPMFSPDGRWLTYSSNRSGAPMIFRQLLSGGKVDRLTYVGRYNATPAWSPQNNKIAFASWIDNRFDLFIMNPDGTNIERLTKNQGSNEDPDFSADGQFIVFSSNRTKTKNIYVMNIDGTFVRRLTYGLGNCVSPKWSRK